MYRVDLLSTLSWLRFFPVRWYLEGKACPAAASLEEWRVCNDHPCITLVFYWETSAWGPCVEDVSMDLNVSSFWNGTSSCAVGVQSRKVSCLKMNTGPVINKRYTLWLGTSQASNFYCVRLLFCIFLVPEWNFKLCVVFLLNNQT